MAALGGTFVGTLFIRPRMKRIPRIQPAGATGAHSRPSARAAVVVAAKDEASTIEAPLRALLAQADEDLQVVVLDDRSTDGTAQVLDRLQAEDPRLLRVRVDELPSGWLGKNHALARGTEAASQGEPEFYLFTDADVVFEPGGLRGAIDFAVEHGLDHLAGAPKVHAASWALGGQVAAFGVLFGLFTRPWSVPDPESSAYVGIGALNLVRRSAYEQAGGHDAIAMRIDDDLRLGKRIKESGGSSAFAFAGDVSSLTWYPTLPSMLKGLHKNAFAGIDFRLSLCVGATVVLGLFFLAPFALAVAPTSWFGASVATRACAAATALLLILGAADSARSAGLPLKCALFCPLGVALFLGVLWRSALGALATGRVVWRGTAYSLRELKDAARS